MVAGIDVGGTKIRWVIMDKRRRVVAARETMTPHAKSSFSKLLKEILMDLKERNITHIGFGVAGSVSGTTLKSSRNLHALAPLDFNDVVPRGVSIRVDNDARCFARSETFLGRGKTAQRMFIITLGTGVGRAFVKQGKVMRIKRFGPAEAWEGSYQKRVGQSARDLAPFLAKGLSPLILEFVPDAVVIGGGRLRTPSLFNYLCRALRRRGVICPIYQSRFRKNAGAIGAALLVS